MKLHRHNGPVLDAKKINIWAGDDLPSKFITQLLRQCNKCGRILEYLLRRSMVIGTWIRSENLKLKTPIEAGKTYQHAKLPEGVVLTALEDCSSIDLVLCRTPKGRDSLFSSSRLSPIKELNIKGSYR